MFVRSASQGMPKVEARRRIQTRTIAENHHDYYTKSYQKAGRGEEDNLRDHLDLIFRNQPRQIQEKLTKLLIRYNASMQYNKNSDMFEVDLLIPFTSDDQKREFMRQFLEIRKQKIPAESNPHQSDKLKVEDIDWIGQYNEKRKFSFNPAGNISDNKGREENRKNGDEIWINQLHNAEAVTGNNSGENDGFDYDADPFQGQHSRKNTGQFPEVMIAPPEPVHEPMDFDKMNEIIARRLKNAVLFIKNTDLRPQNSTINAQESLNAQNVFTNTGLLKLEKTFRQDSIIDQLYSTDRFNQDKAQTNTERLMEEQPPLFESSQETFAAQKDFIYSYPTEEQNPFIKIAEEPQQDEYEPDYYSPKSAIQDRPKDDRGSKAMSFQDFSNKYKAVKSDKNAAKGKAGNKGPTTTKPPQSLKGKFSSLTPKDRLK